MGSNVYDISKAKVNKTLASDIGETKPYLVDEEFIEGCSLQVTDVDVAYPQIDNIRINDIPELDNEELPEPPMVD